MPSKTAESTMQSVTPPEKRVANDDSDIACRDLMELTPIDLGNIERIRVLDEDGNANPALDPELPPDELLRIHRAMVMTRKFDVRMLTMQRQGQMGTFAPGLGQEATQIGQVEPLDKEDWFSPSYRSFGAQLCRGWTMDGLMLLWDGYFDGFEIPQGNELPFSIVVGSHVPVAVGIAMGIRARNDEGVVLVNFGDGAFSQGPVCEALNFAAVFKAPVVFMCENNGYAISVPVEKQTGTRTLAERGSGFGVPAMRVDGNDILAVIAATRRAVERARKGEGPTLIESVTYRMEVHTTADDPKLYRSDDEVEHWQSRDPISRFERYLIRQQLLDKETIERIEQECEQQAIEAREKFHARAKAKPRDVFNYIYQAMPPELADQQREYFERLDRKGVE